LTWSKPPPRKVPVEELSVTKRIPLWSKVRETAPKAASKLVMGAPMISWLPGT
jgi:hypothetical protein